MHVYHSLSLSHNILYLRLIMMNPEDKQSETTTIDEQITHMIENDQGAKRMHELMERKWQIEGKYCSLRAMYMRCKCSLLTLL